MDFFRHCLKENSSCHPWQLVIWVSKPIYFYVPSESKNWCFRWNRTINKFENIQKHGRWPTLYRLIIGRRRGTASRDLFYRGCISIFNITSSSTLLVVVLGLGVGLDWRRIEKTKIDRNLRFSPFSPIYRQSLTWIIGNPISPLLLLLRRCNNIIH